MTRTAKIWLATGAGVLLAALLVWFLPAWLGLSGGSVWILRVGLWLLLLVAGGLTVRLLLPPSAEPDVRGDDPLAVAFRSARERLGALTRGSGKGRPSFDALPLTLVLGPRHTTKTTLLANSGLDAELLAGEVYRGDLVAPTDGVNLWYAGDTVWVEAGGPLLDDPVRWSQIGRLLSPRRLGAVLGRGGQPPRQAVVCFSCESFQMSGASEGVPAAARALRDRLGDLSQELGIRLPVYVLFTKADRIPHFAEYVRPFSREEVGDFLGVTLPLADRPDPGTHAEREGARIMAGFEGLVRKLSRRRLSVLSRDAEGAGSAYEFPREVRKLSGLATSFLVELCRPGQRSVGPFLRGFYFTGVRPVVVDGAAPAAAAPALGLGGSGMDATRVFRLQDIQGFQKAAESARGPSRRVPQWLFHERVFRDVVLADQVARAVTAGGVRVNLLRRMALGGVTAVAGLLLLWLTVSFFGNRALQADARVAMEGVQGMEATGSELPPLEVLQRVDSLRQVGVRLRGYATHGAPLRLRLGLYRGDAVLEEVRRVYFGTLDRLALGRVHGILSSELASLPDEPEPTSDYGRTYDALKAYLITTDHAERSTPEFLTPVLLDRWTGDPANFEAEWLELARAQMDFYATELLVDDPYARQGDASTVSRARRFLNQFAGADRFYQALVADASNRNPSVRFATVFPGSESVVSSPHEVAGAFTEGGWNTVQESLRDIDRLLAGETWVVGEQALTAAERAGLAEEIRARYVTAYRDEWRQYLNTTRSAPPGSPSDAEAKLNRLGGNLSPLLQALALASRNTAVDSALAGAFQPVHQVMPPDIRDRFVAESNAQYRQSLIALAQVMGRLAGPTPDAAAASQGQAAVDDARGVVQAMGGAFAVTAESGPVAQRVSTLLEEPIVMAGRLLERAGDIGVNAGGASFCSSIQPVLRKYPFGASADEVGGDELMAAFQPPASLFWNFYQETLAQDLTRQGGGFGPRPGSNLNPAFVAFFNRGVDVSRAFFGQEVSPRAEPSIPLGIRLETSAALESVELLLDQRTLRFTRTDQASQAVSWTPRMTRVELFGTVGGNRVRLLPTQEGPWALFRFLQQAEWTDTTIPNQYLLRWSQGAGGVTITGQVTLGPGTRPIMRPGFFQGFQCVGRVAG